MAHICRYTAKNEQANCQRLQANQKLATDAIHCVQNPYSATCNSLMTSPPITSRPECVGLIYEAARQSESPSPEYLYRAALCLTFGKAEK